MHIDGGWGMKVEAEEHRLGPGNIGGGQGTSVGAVGASDATGYDLSRLKPESSWALIQAEPRLAESILPASTLT